MEVVTVHSETKLENLQWPTHIVWFLSRKLVGGFSCGEQQTGHCYSCTRTYIEGAYSVIA